MKRVVTDDPVADYPDDPFAQVFTDITDLLNISVFS